MSSDSTNLADVLLPLALEGPYSYRIPAGMELVVGNYVNVPLGPRTLIGVVTFTVLKVGLNAVKIPGVTNFDLLRPFVMGVVLLIALVINGRIAKSHG